MLGEANTFTYNNLFYTNNDLTYTYNDLYHMWSYTYLDIWIGPTVSQGYSAQSDSAGESSERVL